MKRLSELKELIQVASEIYVSCKIGDIKIHIKVDKDSAIKNIGVLGGNALIDCYYSERTNCLYIN